MKIQRIQQETKNQKSKIKFVFDPWSINDVYLPLVSEKSRYLHLYGGAGSGKSVFAAQKLIIRTLTEKGHRFLLLRKVARTIRGSQFALLKSLISYTNMGVYFSARESDMRITCTLNGNEIVTSGLDDREKLKSIFGITSVWIEEATELDINDFTQVDLRLRGKTPNYKQIILTYNPVNALHWLNTTHKPDSCTVRTTYADNKFIDEEYKKMLESLKFQNAEYYDVYVLGKWGIQRNIVYQPFEIIDCCPGYENFDDVIYGLDFGFNNQTALIEIGLKDKEYYLNELIYESRLTNSALIEKMQKLGIESSKYIYCDSSEAGRIEELRNAGFNAKAAKKNIKDGIDFVKSCKIYSKPGNKQVNKEVLMYAYKEDGNGKIFDEPVKENDHALDAIRYALYSHRNKTPYIGLIWI